MSADIINVQDATMIGEFGKCIHCPEDATVKVNQIPLCLECWRKALGRIEKTMKELEEKLFPDKPPRRRGRRR